jgi:hypothetical protein
MPRAGSAARDEFSPRRAPYRHAHRCTARQQEEGHGDRQRDHQQVDPHLGKCRAYTQPEEGDYLSELTVAFGGEIDLTATSVGLTLTTGEFPRD